MSQGWKFYMIFFCFNFVNFWLVYLFYPETAHKSLEEIDLLFLQNTDAKSRMFPGLNSIGGGQNFLAAEGLSSKKDIVNDNIDPSQSVQLEETPKSIAEP